MDRLHAVCAHLRFTPPAVDLRVLFVPLDISATKLAYLFAMRVQQVQEVQFLVNLARCARQEHTLRHQDVPLALRAQVARTMRWSVKHRAHLVLQEHVVRHWALLQTHPARCARQERTLRHQEVPLALRAQVVHTTRSKGYLCAHLAPLEHSERVLGQQQSQSAFSAPLDCPLSREARGRMPAGGH